MWILVRTPVAEQKSEDSFLELGKQHVKKYFSFSLPGLRKKYGRFRFDGTVTFA